MSEHGMNVDAYDQLVVPRYEPIATRLHGMIQTSAGHRVLEVGAGTGLLSGKLAASGMSLIVTDVSAEMLVRAREKLGDSTTPPAILVADARQLPLRTSQFDMVVSNLAPLPDSIAALLEARRVLRNHGRVILSMWDTGHSEVKLINQALSAADIAPIPGDAVPRAIKRMARLGFRIHRRMNHEATVEFNTVDSYLEYRASFGIPASWPGDKYANYLSHLRAILMSEAGEVIRLHWKVCYLEAGISGSP